MNIHKTWQNIINNALNSLDKEYLKYLQSWGDFFPDRDNFLNAFKSLDRKNTKAILFGQDPYPRQESATGFAFIDGLVEEIFTPTGFSKRVNRATSLRNFLKMQLKAGGYLTDDVSQEAIARLDKTNLISSIFDLRDNFHSQGTLLLNTSLIFTQKKDITKHMKNFKPFMKSLLESLKQREIELILFGNEAKKIEKILPKEHKFILFKAPHPYNVSFISDESVLKYFGQKRLLERQKC